VTDDDGPQTSERTPSGDPLLDVREVSVRFGGVAALSEVSLRVHAGTVTGLIGPNGAGKTTLFNVVSGLQRPDRGHVRIGGRDVTGLGTHRRARLGLARTFQRLELFSHLTSEDNVRVGLEAGRRSGLSPRVRRAARVPASSATALLDRVGVGGTAAHPVNALPTGSARLVELARALSIGPRVLLLDEPCSGLDDAESVGLGRLLRELAAEERAVLLVEHDMSLVLDVCDLIYVLDFGEIIASGTPSEIREHPAVQAAYLGTLKVGGSQGQEGRG
jgi:branched-chain amino acid transport system ATP-binding protein